MKNYFLYQFGFLVTWNHDLNAHNDLILSNYYYGYITKHESWVTVMNSPLVSSSCTNGIQGLSSQTGTRSSLFQLQNTLHHPGSESSHWFILVIKVAGFVQLFIFERRCWHGCFSRLVEWFDKDWLIKKVKYVPRQWISLCLPCIIGFMKNFSNIHISSMLCRPKILFTLEVPVFVLCIISIV